MTEELPDSKGRAQKRWARPLAGIAAGALIIIAVMFALSRLNPRGVETTRTGVKMVAVLPFENLGGPEDDYFVDGMTEEIMSRLAGVPGLGVISRTSAIQYKNTEKMVKQIGQELGVDYILEGTVRWVREDDGMSRVRITPQLILVETDTHVWTERYDRVLDDVFTVQSTIAQRVIDELDIVLAERDRRVIERWPTDNLEAYQAYLRGLYYAENSDLLAENLTKATQSFDRAIELDPKFAHAYAYLAGIRSYIYHSGFVRTDELLMSANLAVDRALELRPDLPEAYIALGYYYYWGHRDYDNALEAFAIAQRDRPNEDRIHKAIAYIQRRQGDFTTALSSLERILKLNPRDDSVLRDLGITLSNMRNYDESNRYLDRAIALTPEQTSSYLYKVWNYWLMGDLTKARATLESIPKATAPLMTLHWFIQEMNEGAFPAALERLLASEVQTFDNAEFSRSSMQLHGYVYEAQGESDLAAKAFDVARVEFEQKVAEYPEDVRYHSSLGIIYAALGRKSDALASAERAVELSPLSSDALTGAAVTVDLADVYTRIGEYDAALDELDHLLSTPTQFMSVQLLRLEPRWAPLRTHPRFQALLERHSGTGS